MFIVLIKNHQKLFYEYLRSQKINVGSSFSSDLNISYDVLQGSLLVPLLVDIDICDFFLDITSDTANYASDITPYECVQHCDNLVSKLELTIDEIFSWFEHNSLKTNALKCRFSSSPYQQASINIKGFVIKSSNCEKMLRITIDSDVTFEEHINKLCQTAREKLKALSRISKYLSQHKNRILFKTFCHFLTTIH